MKDINITLFNAVGGKKTPYSPYGDKTFIFVNKRVQSLKEAYLLMVNHYTLSKPLNLHEPVKMHRRKKDFEPYLLEKITNIALDIDEVKTQNDYLNIIEYFKKKNYSLILGKSRSWNGTSNFNLKGILRINLSNSKEILNQILSQLQAELGDSCKIDRSVSVTTSLQAPTNSKFIVYLNEKGKILKDSDIEIQNIKNNIDKSVDISYSNELIDECLKIFNNLGYLSYSEPNDNGSINFSHYSEVKSKGGYFWFPENPFIMNHHNKDKTLSIFHLIKDTKVGKEWLKDKTKKEQRNKILNSSKKEYKEQLLFNERYIKVNNEKKQIIDKFLSTPKSVLKLKSAMGTGKSSIIEHTINEVHKMNKKVILISSRVTVAMDYASKYNLMIYKNPKSISSSESLVVQYDSLHRYDLSKYDVVIFDEFISLLLHHRGNLTDKRNINAAKFKILLERKQILIADAFLTGYEDIFLKDRTIYNLENAYLDDIKLYEYKNKDYFISRIIEESLLLEDNEHISCSFTSLNTMKITEYLLRQKGIKVVVLDSETSQITREIIFKNFKKNNHNAFQVILYTPTLTVGVSNLNNVNKHFHYDSGMSTDVISSLQMIKRSRTAKEIHFYLEERQFYLDTDIESINNSVETTINQFYNKKDKTLLIDIDYETGRLKLTELGKYINQIEVFNNILKNNHANAFRIMLDFQFKRKPKTINDVADLKLRELSSTIKKIIKEENKKIIENLEVNIWDIDIEEIKNKISEKSKEEKILILMDKIQNSFKEKIDDEDLKKLVSIEIEEDYKFMKKIKKLIKVYRHFKSDSYTKYLLTKVISEDISILQNKENINFLNYLINLDSEFKLQDRYTNNDLKNYDNKFKKFLKSIGYIKKDNLLVIDSRILYFLKYF